MSAAKTEQTRAEIVRLTQEIRTLTVRPNAFPIFHRSIDSSKGIRITGKFKTTYPDVPSPMSYITVRRQDDRAVVADGFGLAWRTGYESSGLYNLYLVDNNILTDDSPIRDDTMLQVDNINNFLAYGISNIEPNTEYKFGLEIDSSWGMKACVYSGSAVGSPNFSSAYDAATNVSGYVMSLGARLDGYEPQSAGTHFGLSVLNSKGYDWIYDDIRITTTVEGYVGTLFKMYANPGEFSESNGFRVYGVGAAQGSPGSYGINWYVWNASSGVWQFMAANAEATTEEFTYDYATLSGYLDDQNFVNILAIAEDSSTDGELNIDYVRLSTIPSSGIHTGHMADMYIHSPAKIARTTTEITGITGGIAELDNLYHPIYEIEQVYYTAGGPVLGELIRDTSDGTGRYTLQNTLPTYTYSTKEDLALSVPLDANISVVYTYYTDGEAVQEFVESDDNRLPTADNLAKIAPPASITFNTLDYRGSIEETSLKTAITTWVNALITEDFEITDLIAHMYTIGVTYIDLTTLDISVIVYNTDGTIKASEAITSSYSITDPNTFYTDAAKMVGVTKL